MGTLLKQCGRGSGAACDIAKRLSVLYAGSVITFSEAKIDPSHPNKLPFKGVLLILDEASQKAPHGSQGHRIYVSTKVAKDKLSGIIGMAVNYQPGDLDAHATRHKVGVVTKAWIEDKKVMVSGFIWDRDFPEADKELKGRHDLGMSMELADVYVDNENASVWNLTDFEFTGATILKKDAAAYTKTSLAANASKEGKERNKEVKIQNSLAAKTATREEGDKVYNMSDKKKEKNKVAAVRRDTGQDGTVALAISAMGGQIGEALNRAFGPLVTEIKASNQRVQDSLEELNGRFHLADVRAAAEDEEDDEVVIAAAARHDDDEDDDDDDNAMSAKSEDDDDDDDMAAARAKDDDDDDSSDDGDDDDSSASMDAMEDLELEDASQEPGEVNKDASNRGHKTSVTKPPKQGEHLAGNVAKGRIHSKAAKGNGKPFTGLDAAAVKLENVYASNRRLRRALQATADESTKQISKLKKQLKTVHAQVERFADNESRRSAMPHELTALAGKAGVNLGDLKASGQKASVAEVDSWFAAADVAGIRIAPEQRVGMKNQLVEMGVMDQGAIDRGYGRIQ